MTENVRAIIAVLETGLIEDVDSWITITLKGIELVKKLKAIKATKEQTA
jgi:hypothetical protein